MEYIEVNDLYHAAYLLLNGMKLEEVKTIPVTGGASCSLRFSGDHLQELTADFVLMSAQVNLFQFRTAYRRITTYVNQARKNAKKNGKEAKS